MPPSTPPPYSTQALPLDEEVSRASTIATFFVLLFSTLLKRRT